MWVAPLVADHPDATPLLCKICRSNYRNDPINTSGCIDKPRKSIIEQLEICQSNKRNGRGKGALGESEIII